MITKELQDLAWSVLPNGNKVYCRNMYRTSHDGNVIDLLERLYGPHNLTSDAEGEEMLTVSRNRLMDAFNSVKIIESSKMSSKMLAGAADMCINTFKCLFGSKCLPDEPCNVASNVASKEPKYHKGEKVFYNGYVYEIEGLVGKNRYALKGLNFDLDEDMIDPCEPYTESEKESRNLSQDPANCDKHFDNILKDSFAQERRLNIAAMIAQGIVANSNPQMVDMNVERVVDLANLTADTLIAECNSPIN